MPQPWEGVVKEPSSAACASCMASTAAGQSAAPSGPPKLRQGQVNDCFLIASLNRAASSPEGRRYLASLVKPLGNGFYEVTLRDRSGRPRKVAVQAARGYGASGDPTLKVIEKAMLVLHDEGDNLGGPRSEEQVYREAGADVPSSAMSALGLANVEPRWARDIVEDYKKGTPGDVHVLSTKTAYDPPLQRALKARGLISNHGYEVVGVVKDRKTGDEMVLLENPWGRQHPPPIPLRAIDSVFMTGTRASIPPPPRGP